MSDTSNKKYVLLYLDSIKVNIKDTTTDPIVFCQSISVKLHDEQNINLIEDWSDIIIGESSKYKGLEGVTEVAIAKFDEITGEYTGGINTDIGLWSVILFETIKNDEGEYTRLTINNAGSDGIGGAGEQESNIKEVYENTLSSINYQIDECVYEFLENIFSAEKYNGCMFINNPDCGLFLNISPKMFNEQENLKSIALTNTISYIADKGGATSGVFRDCIKLESANIPKHLDNYVKYNFDTNKYDIINPKRIVPSYYFHNCESLEKITIPSGITQIGFSAFYGCDNVETIDIPSSVSMIYSKSLLTVKRINTRYINVIGDANAINKPDITFYNKSIGYNKPANDDETYYSNAVVISINDRGTVTLSGSNAANDTSFIDNMGAGSKIYIDCTEIGGVSIGSTANPPTRFYYGGFIGTTFETIYIGPSVSKICDFAFYNIKGTNLIINNGNVLATKYDNDREEGSINDIKDGDKYLVKTPFINSNFTNINILNCATVGVNALHSLKSSKLTFYEKDDIFEIDGDNVITNTITVTNTTTLTKLSDNAFYNSTFSSIIIPSTVTKNDINCTNISNTAFLQTKGSLELNCDISGYETNINQNPRAGILINSGFRNINFNYTGTIPKNILYENKSVESIELGDNIKTISENAFYLCTNLTGILSLPTSMTSIHETSFIGCTFSKFEADSSYFKTANNGMYLLTDNGSSIVLFANRHSDIQINDNTFNIDITTVNKICSYAFAYAFSDYANSTVYAVNIPKNIKHFGSNVFYNCYKLTRIIFFGSNIPNFDDDASTAGISVYKENDFYSEINTVGSFVDLPLLKEVYIGYKNGVLLSNYLNYSDAENTWFLHNTLRKSYTNAVPSVDGITIYVHENLVDDYKIWEDAGYIIAVILDDIPSPGPPVEDDDSYDADIDDPEGEEWPWDGGNGDIITNEEDHIPPVVDNSTDNDEETTDSWIKHENNVFKIPIKQLGTPAINVYGCRLDLLHLTDSYSDERTSPTPEMIVDQFGNVDFSALDYLKFNKVSNETHYGSEYDKMLKLYMGDYGNNFLIVFTVTGIDKFDATTKLFTSGVEYAAHRESNWLKTEIVRITKKPESEAYYVVLLCTCLKLQNKDNYNCRSAIVSVNYGSQILDTYVNGQTTEGITTKIRVIQHKTELRLSNDTKEINITDLPVLFCQKNERTTFTGKFFIGFPKNFWGNDYTIKDDGSSSNKNKLREYINDYFRISYDKEKIKVVGQKTKINDLDYTYIFDLDNDNKYANIKSEGSTTSTLMTFSSCADKLGNIHEEYYCVTFKIENLKTSLAGGVWNINIYNIGEPAELLNIHAVEDQTDIPSIVLFDENVSVYGKQFDGDDVEDKVIELSNNNVCYSVYDSSFVALDYFIPVAITNLPVVSNTIIYPEAEVVDLCVDSSCIIDCGNEYNTLFGTGGGDLFNNYRGVLTLNTNNATQPKIIFPISSSKLKHTALSSIKYTHNKNIENTGLYSYFKNSAEHITNCSCNANITKIKRTGSKDDSDILENTTAFLYEFNTGISCIKQKIGDHSTPEYVYNNFLSINNNTLYSNSINGSDSNIVYHDENYIKENNLCFYGNKKLVYDKFYNLLAPLYPYSEYTTKYKTYQSDESQQILVNNYQNATYVKLMGKSDATIYKNTEYTYINNESEITATGPTYYCTSTPGIVITSTNTINEDNFNIYTGQAYLVTDASDVKINIGFNTSTEDYTKESTNNTYMNTSIYSNASTVTLHQLLKISSSELTASLYSQIDSDRIKERCNELNIDVKHGLVISIIRTMNISFTPKNTADLIVYEKIINGSSEYYNINNEKINKNSIYTCTETDVIYDKFVYIGDSTASSFKTNYSVTYNYSDVFNENSVITVDKFNIMSPTASQYNSVGVYRIFERGDSIYNNRGNMNMTPTITGTAFETNSLNIGNNILTKYDKNVDQTRFRQVFLNFYYSILDNGIKTKVYADNTDGILMHLRLINEYTKSLLDTGFTVDNINIFNFSFTASSTNIFTGLETTIPSYPSKI